MSPGTRPSRSAAEKVSFAVSSAIVLAIAVTIGVLWTQDSRPPAFTVTMVGEPRREGEHRLVQAEVRNTGTTAAVDVKVLAEVTKGGERVPVGDQVVPFLPGGASRIVVFVIDDGDLAGLTLRVESYSVPQ